MATMTLKKASALAEAKGITLSKEGSTYLVEFPNGKSYLYRDTLTRVCQRIGLIDEANVESLRDSDCRYLQREVNTCGELEPVDPPHVRLAYLLDRLDTMRAGSPIWLNTQKTIDAIKASMV
jgi:hypothetical protein